MLFLKANKHQNLWNSLVIMVMAWFGLAFMKLGRALAVKIIDIDCQ